MIRPDCVGRTHHNRAGSTSALSATARAAVRGIVCAVRGLLCAQIRRHPCGRASLSRREHSVQADGHRAAVRARRCADDEAHRHPRHAAYGADASRRGTDASGEECAMPAWVHGEWRLLHALVSHTAGSRPEGRALPKQIDAERQQLLPRNATALGPAARSLRCRPQLHGPVVTPRLDFRTIQACPKDPRTLPPARWRCGKAPAMAVAFSYYDRPRGPVGRGRIT